LDGKKRKRVFNLAVNKNKICLLLLQQNNIKRRLKMCQDYE